MAAGAAVGVLVAFATPANSGGGSSVLINGRSKCGTQTYPGMACAGTGVYNHTKTTEEICCRLCASDHRCAQWTFHGSKTEGKCVLSSVAQSAKVKAGCTCGMKAGPTPPEPPTPAPPGPGPPPTPPPMPPPTPGPHAPLGPDPSLDTIPVICHSFDGKHSSEQWPRDPEEIATLSKFRMVVIEKFEGTCWDQCYVHPVPGKCVPSCDVEHYMVGTAKALKAANPKLSVLMYLNSMMMFPFYSLASRYLSQPSLLLHDQAGQLVTLQNDAGLGNLTVPDWGQAAARELWWGELQNYTGTGFFDGVFADKARKNANKDQLCNHGCGNLSHSVAVAWGAVSLPPPSIFPHLIVLLNCAARCAMYTVIRRRRSSAAHDRGAAHDWSWRCNAEGHLGFDW
jgi:hypothetical protein